MKFLLLGVFRETEVDSKALVEEYIAMHKSLDQNGDLAKRIGELERTIDTVENWRRTGRTGIGHPIAKQCAQRHSDSEARALFGRTAAVCP